MVWTQDEELRLIKELQNKTPLETIAKNHNKDIKSIDFRLNKIIFENMINHNKNAEAIGGKLNIDTDEVLQRYITFKSYKDKFDEQNKNNNKYLNTNKHLNTNILQEGGKINILNKLSKIEEENKLLKIILENKKLHRELNKQIENGNINKSIKNIIRNIRNN